ncbi:hypothetical protein KHA80_05905 [Anaerobacillus sp. HL2]|nr:hypothetical protein KHA80_05905 [Anaerobacillus sp. HL2]
MRMVLLFLDGSVTYATGVALIVRALDLNIGHMRFIKEPKASDYYTNVEDNKWYSDLLFMHNLTALNYLKT